MTQDPIALINQSIHQLLSQYAPLFESMGMNLFFSFATIIFSWFGVQAALAREGFPWAKFSAMVQEVLFCYVMLAFYTTPIPGIGSSFTHLILDQTTAMVGTLHQTNVQSVMETLNKLGTDVPFPTFSLELYNPLGLLQFVLLMLLIGGAQAALLMVTMFGYIAIAVIILIGPVLIPFKIVPKMEWMFWGWLRAFIQHSFYQVVAAAYLLIFGGFLTQFISGRYTTINTSDMSTLFLPLVLALITFTLGTLMVPSLTYSIFAGRAGEYVMPRWR